YTPGQCFERCVTIRHARKAAKRRLDLKKKQDEVVPKKQALDDISSMGNTSCVPAVIGSNSGSKVVRWDRTLSVYPRLMKASDVMVDNPGQFICPATCLQIGHRVSGLAADDELEPRILYFLLPMELFYSVLTMRFCKFPSDRKRSESNGQITEPDASITVFVRQRSWRPALETIVEAC
uniref:Uncharacterized protein n=1 Tax=Chenopodium quinoa TaxID=63459 RepID=A0A803NA57_CHEQI